MTDDQRRAVRRGGVDPSIRSSIRSSIRTAAIWHTVAQAVESLQAAAGDRPLRVVDVGGGTGGLAVPLAELGYVVTVIDPSPDALAALERRAQEVGVAERVTAVQGDAATLADHVPAGSADVVTCHGVLEVLDDDAAVAAATRSLAELLAPDGVLSVVVAQRLAAVLARTLAGRFDQAQAVLTSPDGRWGPGDPAPRRFDAEQVGALLTDAGLQVVSTHGVRIFSDLIPAAYIDTDAERAALLALEEAIVADPAHDFLGRLGAALHVVARRPQPAGDSA